MSQRYFTEQPLQPGPFVLEGAEAHHLLHVSRVQRGEMITLFNGDGAEYQARIVAMGKRQVELEMIREISISRESARPLIIACPLPKGDRAAFLIEKLTELGVACYLPLQTSRSVVHPREGKAAKLRRYVVEASKQCGRNVLMQIAELATWSELLQRTDLPQHRFLADAQGESLSFSPFPEGIIAVGPEGGWSSEERQQAEQAGWQCIRLAPAVLRVETAALAAAARWLG
jgi:16S rRNA (uracil1498-N3)-methyltransferase